MQEVRTWTGPANLAKLSTQACEVSSRGEGELAAELQLW